MMVEMQDMKNKNIAAAAVFLMVSLLWNYLAGKDLNWDFINYHFYGAASMVDGRLAQDYFAASIQSYLNPLPYIPQFLMIRWGWHSAVVAGVLTVIHTLNLLFIWKITHLLAPDVTDRSRLVGILFLSTALAFVSPIHLTQVGGSFADTLTCIPMLGGLYLILRDWTKLEPKRLLWVGLLFGAAAGAKLTNGLFVAVALLLIGVSIWRARGVRQMLTGCLVFAFAAGLGILTTHGYWSYLLWEQFGNPFFPLFNKIIASPDFLLSSFQDRRFLGEGWPGLFALPFEMTKLEPWIYTENISVDIRVAALVLLASLLVLLTVSQRLARWPATKVPNPLTSRVLGVLLVFWIVSYLLWGNVFRIGRYAYLLWLLVGPLLAGLLMHGFNVRVTRVALAVILVLQVFVLYTSGSPRWTPTKWSAQWLPVSVPDELKQYPYTLLTMGTQSYSAFIPFVHPSSSVINLVGQYNQPAGPKMTAKLQAHLSKPIESIRIVFRDPASSPVFTQPADRTRNDVNAVVSLYGLRLANGLCQPIVFEYESIEGTLLEESSDKKKAFRDGDRLMVCPATRLSSTEQNQINEKLLAIDKMFDDVEKVCGDKLSPHGGQTLRGLNGWLRNYFNTLNNVATDGESIYIRPFRSMVDFDLGLASSWKEPLANGRVLTCPALPKTMRIDG